MIFSKVHSLYTTAFLARYQHVFSFLQWGHHFLEFSVNCTSLYKTAFSSRDQHVLLFSYWVHYFLAVFSKVQEFVHNSIFSLISARFVIFALSEPLFSNFQQSERVVSKHGFQPEIRRFCDFCTLCTTL